MTAEKPKILIADDQADILTALRLLLKSEGYELKTAQSPAAALEILRAAELDLFLMDLNYARDPSAVREGIDLLSQVQKLDPLLPVVVMTGWGSIDLAVEAMHLGAVNFIQKPWENQKLLEMIRDQIGKGKTRRRAEKLRTAEKIEIAEAEVVQRAFLPPSLPELDRVELAVRWQPKRQLGGDYYDIFPLDSDRVGFCVADAAGKGLPAALLMSNLQAGLRSFASASSGPAEVVSRLNQLMCANHMTNKFVTLFYGVLDLKKPALTYTNAGHFPPVLRRADGTRLFLKETGGIVGFFPDWTYEQDVLPLSAGDTLWLFTDGILEARDPAGAEFGPTCLDRVLDEAGHVPLAEGQELIWNAVLDFCAGSLDDDATLLALRLKTSSSSVTSSP
jgi:sigma-B regulation protein RsbU (phosphoserine phosphatase)